MRKEINLVLEDEDKKLSREGDQGGGGKGDEVQEDIRDERERWSDAMRRKPGGTRERRKGVILRRELPGKVYYVESEKDASVMVGIEVVVEKVRTEHEQYVRVRWFDTLREREMTAVRFFEAGDVWGFERDAEEGGGEYYFWPMTLEIYNEKVKEKTKGKFEFENEEEMIEEFLETKRFVE